MKKILLSATALVALSATAFAADLPSRSSSPMLSAQPAFSWAGLYVGANVGFVHGTQLVDDYECGLACTSLSFAKSSVSGGAAVGYNFAYRSAVFGLEGDYNLTSVKTSRFVADWSSAPQGAYHSTNIKGFGTIRGRAGLGIDNVLLFATAGLALVNRAANGHSVNGEYAFSVSDTAAGYVFGGGVEYALTTNLTAKFDYLHVVTPGKWAQGTGSNEIGSPSGVYQVTTSIDTVRAGLNYKFQ